jgi:hypothetical protein
VGFGRDPFKRRRLGRTAVHVGRATIDRHEQLRLLVPMNAEKIATWVILPILLLGCFAAYLGAYFCLADSRDISRPHGEYRVRHYAHRWMCAAFRPIAKVEEFATGKRVIFTVPQQNASGG